MAEKGNFISEIVIKARQPLDQFITRTGLTREKVIGTMKTVTDISDDKLDYVASFLDASTSFVSHTGIQSVARELTAQGAKRFGYEANVKA